MYFLEINKKTNDFVEKFSVGLFMKIPNLVRVGKLRQKFEIFFKMWKTRFYLLRLLEVTTIRGFWVGINSLKIFTFKVFKD